MAWIIHETKEVDVQPEASVCDVSKVELKDTNDASEKGAEV